MLENRDDYEFLTENALKRINIKGAPYPLRSQKLVITGEDEAYLREAMLERRYIKGMSADKYNSAILRITREILRAKWLYDPISTILQYSGYEWIDGVARRCKWMDADKVKDYASIMPSGAVVYMSGQNPTSTRPQGVSAAISDAAADIAATRQELSDNLAARFSQLSDDLDALYDTRDSLVEQAEQTRDTAINGAESSLQSALEQMKTEHEAAVQAIEEEYQRATEDPDADQEAARKKYEEDLLAENNRYEIDVSERKDRARLEKAKAEDDYRKAVWDAERDLYDEAKRKFAEYVADVDELDANCAADIADIEADRNAEIETLEKSAVYTGYLRLDTTAGEAPKPAGDGVDYSDALSGMAANRKEMEISRLCLDKYLRKTPLLVSKPFEGQVDETFVAHAPSSDATMRAYADLERMRCLAMTPPTVYRNAYYTGDPSDIAAYYNEKSTASGGGVEFYYKSESDDGTVAIDYSDTSFSVFYGRRLEVEKDWVEAIYATIRIYRDETARSDDVPSTVNRTFGFMRVKLENEGMQCESDLADIDRVRDELAETLAHYAEIRDSAKKTANDAYLLAYDAAQKAHDDAIDAAKTTQTNSENAAHRTFMSSMESAEKTFNTEVAEIEEDDISDEEKERQIDAAKARYHSAFTAASDAEAEAVRAAVQAYQQAEAAAIQARSDAIAAAERTRDAAYGAADEAYDESTEGLAEDAEAEIADIKERPSQRRQDARDDYDDAVAAARDQRDDVVTAASNAFNDALYSLTVGGVPILPNHEDWLEYTPSFPYRMLTSDAYADASQAEREAFNAAFGAASDAYTAAVNAYNAATKAASYDYWYALSQIEDIREDARCRWTFTPEAIDSDGISLPSGDNASHVVSLSMAGIEHFDVVYKPKSITGADFADYYAELDEEAATGPTAP